MSLNVVIGLVGSIATILVVVGMILLTPQGIEPSHTREDTRAVDDVAPATPTATEPARL
jgi:hypothetical protein